jgi:probable HAF family extracellular repeat protein
MPAALAAGLAGTERAPNDLVGDDTAWTSFLSATGINNRGQIVGTGSIAGETHIFLMTPTPEPSTLALLAAAGLTRLALRRQRNKKTCFGRGRPKQVLRFIAGA